MSNDAITKPYVKKVSQIEGNGRKLSHIYEMRQRLNFLTVYSINVGTVGQYFLATFTVWVLVKRNINRNMQKLYFMNNNLLQICKNNLNK